MARSSSPAGAPPLRRALRRPAIPSSGRGPRRDGLRRATAPRTSVLRRLSPGPCGALVVPHGDPLPGCPDLAADAFWQLLGAASGSPKSARRHRARRATRQAVSRPTSDASLAHRARCPRGPTRPGIRPTGCSGFPNHRFQPGARSYPGHTGSALDEPAKTLKAGVHGVPGGENMLLRPEGRVRYFSVRESARLQAFPDDFLFHGTWTETMRQLGNAAPVTLAELLARDIRSHLDARGAVAAVA